MARRIADGVKCAVNRLRPAQFGFTTAQAPEHVFNRRWFLKPGAIPPDRFGTIDQVKMNPAAGSPEMPNREEKVSVPLQVLRIGPECIGTMPGEPFCEIGLEFRQRAAMQPAVLVEWAHGGFGYIPTAKHFPWGGYETWLGSRAFEPHGSEKLLDTLLEMVAELRAPK